jgi:hypothetical protein
MAMANDPKQSRLQSLLGRPGARPDSAGRDEDLPGRTAARDPAQKGAGMRDPDISCLSPKRSSRTTCRSSPSPRVPFGKHPPRQPDRVRTKKKLNLAHVILETLEEMESSGGPEPSMNIIYLVPTTSRQSSGPRCKLNDLDSFFR